MLLINPHKTANQPQKSPKTNDIFCATSKHFEVAFILAIIIKTVCDVCPVVLHVLAPTR